MSDFKAEQFQKFIDFLESDGKTDFDMFAVDSDEWDFLRDVFPGLVVNNSGGACPFQADGTLEGCRFYYRDRGGWAYLRVGRPGGKKEPISGADVYWSASVETEEFEGSANFVKNLWKMIPALERSAFPYEFRGREVHVDSDWQYELLDTFEDRTGWGFTAAEAYEDLVGQVSPYLVEHGFSAERQLELLDAQCFDPVPVVSDSRVFPEVDPVFRVVTPERLERS